jgi:hypothetical protein
MNRPPRLGYLAVCTLEAFEMKRRGLADQEEADRWRGDI